MLLYDDGDKEWLDLFDSLRKGELRLNMEEANSAESRVPRKTKQSTSKQRGGGVKAALAADGTSVWEAEIFFDGRTKFLGQFHSETEVGCCCCRCCVRLLLTLLLLRFVVVAVLLLFVVAAEEACCLWP